MLCGLLGQRCVNTVWKSLCMEDIHKHCMEDKMEFLQRCTFAAVDQDPLLTY